MNYAAIIGKSAATCEVDNLVIKIEREFETMHNLYNVFVKELTGRWYSIFDTRVVNYKEVLKLDGLSFLVKDHGFSKAFFLTYKKPTFLWFSKHKSFYFASGYDFHIEYESSTRYDFYAVDYKMILGVIENENNRLQGMIEDVRVKRLNKELLK